MKTKLGLKYCGGCRSTYDRKAAAEAIKAALEDIYEIEIVQDNSVYDIILIVSGCTAQCANISTLPRSTLLLQLYNEDSVSGVSAQLRRRGLWPQV